MRKLLVAVVVLLVLVAAADRVAVFAADHVVASRIRTTQQLTSDPTVDIRGFPFLTQFASGRYAHVTATASEVPVAETGLKLSRLDLSFRDVTASRDFRTFTARAGRATAVISYTDLGAALGVTLGYAGDGRIRVTKTFTVGGATLKPSATVTPRLSGEVLTFADATINGVGELPAAVQAVLRQAFGKRLDLSGLPFDVRVKRLAVSDAGITLTLSGTGLRYTGSS
ncbi:LmeA family phospholipid-binding protein [Nocardioides mangrovicus]|uniref:LmeA family phospholipid-binding protein n=1 Tax=Nocardioides mangrovicus TaxID=2478913 RepID=UPI00131492EF|nr:DUF2993 domain-containing protein [Nocardioides mangrovicus]